VEEFAVLSPQGLPATDSKAAAPRVPDLNGRTIGEIWNGVFKGDITFPLIRKALQARYPQLKTIAYSEFPHTHGSDNATQQRERARELVRLAREQGCDAVISGNGA
jgi:hypothetical protein